MNYLSNNNEGDDTNNGEMHAVAGSWRFLVGSAVFAAGMLSIVSSVPPLLYGLWIAPPAGGVPWEVVRGLLAFIGAGLTWLIAGLAWVRLPWCAAVLVTVAGYVIIVLGIGDR